MGIRNSLFWYDYVLLNYFPHKQLCTYCCPTLNIYCLSIRQWARGLFPSSGCYEHQNAASIQGQDVLGPAFS